MTWNVSLWERDSCCGWYYDDKRALLAAADATERVRISVNDDFLGKPVAY